MKGIISMLGIVPSFEEIEAGSRGIFQFMAEFFGNFFANLWSAFSGVFTGLWDALNIGWYIDLINVYGETVGGAWIWVVGILCLLCIVALLVGAVWGIVILVRTIIERNKIAKTKYDLVQEVRALSREVMRLNLEKDKILSMKVSQIGLNPNEISSLTGEDLDTLNGEKDKEEENGSRYYRLTKIDEEFKDYVAPEFETDFTLPELCERFRNFACSKLGLFYEPGIIRTFIASFGSTRVIILQGISGTGKTSLPYAFGKFIQNDTLICSVQPSWRDRSELFGYFNEFTKRYNETDMLEYLYKATYMEDVHVAIMDECNIARIEYYFAELLSILEMPSRDEWIINLTPSQWDTDPVHIVEGRLQLPSNVWYVGTANNDDSTFAITDKVYDRAMPIDINSKGVAFDAPDTEPMRLSAKVLEQKLDEAKVKYAVSRDTLNKLGLLDDYVIEHFRLAFGNRIVKQLNEFIPCYVACGGTELEGLDLVLTKKIFRKFEAMNLAYIRDEIDGLCDYLDVLFGQDMMKESKAYLLHLKKLI